jgi:hypothetical protein
MKPYIPTVKSGKSWLQRTASLAKVFGVGVKE